MHSKFQPNCLFNEIGKPDDNDKEILQKQHISFNFHIMAILKHLCLTYCGENIVLIR